MVCSLYEGIVVGVGGHLIKFTLRVVGALEISRSGLNRRVDKLLVGELVLCAGGNGNLRVDVVDVSLKVALHTLGALLLLGYLPIQQLLCLLCAGLLRVNIIL